MSATFTDDDRADFEGDVESRGLADQLDLQYYLRILRKYKVLILLFTATVTGLAGYYAYTATPIFSATSTLLIESQGTQMISIEELVGVDTQNADYYETQFELLRSRALADRVVETMNLWNHPELAAAGRGTAAASAESEQIDGKETAAKSSWLSGVKQTFGLAESGDVANVAEQRGETQTSKANPDLTSEKFSDIDLLSDTAPITSLTVDALREDNFASRTREQQAVVNNFMTRLSISPVRKTKLVLISYESADPVFAAKVANTVGEQYIESYLDAKLELTTKASTWLNQRLGKLKETLDASEDRLITFKEQNGLVDVDGSVGRLNEQELLLVTAELAQARSELSGSADLYREVQALRDQPELLESIPSIQADPLVQRVKIEQGQAQRTLDELLNRYGDRHPRVVDAKSQLASLDTTLQGHINRVVGTIAKDYQLVQQRVRSIEAKLVSGKQEIQAIGTKKFELDSLEREVLTNRTIYDTFFSRITEANSADGLETANARISDLASIPLDPVKPKKQLIIALAALGSLILSALMAFLYEQMDDTIKGVSDVEDKLGMKMLGILPLLKSGMLNRSQTLPLNPVDIVDKKGTFAESVSTVRTTLCAGSAGAKRKIIMITSSVPSEGKSTVSLNLAFSLAQLEKVLLIDCDLRRPTVGKAAGLDKNAPGLSDLITKASTARECIYRGVFDGCVDILPSGVLPAQPLELLSSKRFENILSQLATHYDRVILDCAPTLAVSDALVLSKYSDAVVYAVKSHETSIDKVRNGLQRLKQVNAPVAGVLMTQVDVDKIATYGGDYYYQGYYDYYGYTEKGSRDDRSKGKLRLSQAELLDLYKDDSDFSLDLDYGNERSAPKRSRDSDIDIDDFDSTMEIGRAKQSEKKSKVVRGRRSLGEDLDIL